MNNRSKSQQPPHDKAPSSIRFFKDGVGIGGYDCRLSNISRNVHTLTQSTAAIFSILGSQSSGVEAVKPIYFTDPEGNNYRVNTFLDNVANGIQDGLCNITVNPNRIARDYEEIQHWDMTTFFRGINEIINKNLEVCMEAFIQEQYDQRNSVFGQYIPYLFGTLGGVMVLSGIAYGMLRGYEYYHQQQPSYSPIDIETGTNTDTPPGSENTKKHSDTSPLITRLELTHQERLENIGFNGEIPDDFICPISKEIMTNPIVLPDEKSYEKSWADRLKPSDPCPQNRNVTVGTQKPGNAILRRQIIEFVEQTEKEYNLGIRNWEKEKQPSRRLNASW